MEYSGKAFRWITLLSTGLIAIAFFSAGCSRPPHDEPVISGGWDPADSAAPQIKLQPGDVIDIKFLKATDLNDNQTIRPDGRISMPLVGEIIAAGKTPEELTQVLNEKFASEVQDPKITVIARSLAGRRVFVGGEVKNAGVYLLTAPTSVYAGVVLAGGFNAESVQSKKVAVVRYNGGKQEIYTFDLHKAEALTNFYLEPRDIVFVPRAGIVKADDWVSHYINKLIPQLPVYFNMPITNKPIFGNQ